MLRVLSRRTCLAVHIPKLQGEDEEERKRGESTLLKGP